MELIGMWHQVAAISAWTGLSIGMLAGLALLVWLDPRLLRLAIFGAILVAVGYFAEIHGNAVGLADGKAEVQAQWDQAKIDAEKQRVARDAEIAREIEAKYQPLIGDRTAVADLQQQVSDYEKQLLAQKMAGAGGTCRLGADALRLRRRK